MTKQTLTRLLDKLRAACKEIEIDLQSQADFNTPEGQSIPAIKARTANYYGVTVADINGRSRMQEVVVPRHVAMYSAYKAGHRFKTISNSFGEKRQHGGVIHAVEKIKFRMENSKQFRAEVESLLQGKEKP